jgi:uncharacterized membrane protein
MQMMPRNQLIFDKVVVRYIYIYIYIYIFFFLQKKDVLPQTIKRKKLTFIIIKLLKFTAPKTLYSLI